MLLAPTAPGHDRSGAPDGSQTATAATDARLQSLLDAAVRDGLPGVSLRVKGPGIDFAGAAGVADLFTGEPLTPDHVMYVASLGKTFTAILALQLCDEGRLALDVPMTTWLPDEATSRIPSSGRITLRHLLSHTSGLIDYMNDDEAWRADFVGAPRRQWSHSDVVPYLYDKPPLFEPGTGYHYSNSNYVLVGLIIEQVTGQPFHMALRERILAPLELNHTFNGHEDARHAQRAHGYIRRRGRVIDTYRWYRHYGLADSGIHSTPDDLALFLEAIFTPEAVLSETMRMEMTNVSETDPAHPRYGLGVFVQPNPWGPGRWYSHDGIDPGYQADMIHAPDAAMTVVLAANASLGRADHTYERLIMAVVRVALAGRSAIPPASRVEPALDIQGRRWGQKPLRRPRIASPQRRGSQIPDTATSSSAAGTAPPTELRPFPARASDR